MFCLSLTSSGEGSTDIYDTNWLAYIIAYTMAYAGIHYSLVVTKITWIAMVSCFDVLLCHYLVWRVWQFLTRSQMGTIISGTFFYGITRDTTCKHKLTSCVPKSYSSEFDITIQRHFEMLEKYLFSFALHTSGIV